MDKVYKQSDLNDYKFIEMLEDNGFDVYSTGGIFNPDYYHGIVNSFSNRQVQLVGSNESILSCSANTFIKTLQNVEKKFQYQLFG